MATVQMERATSWMEAMHTFKVGTLTVRSRYEHLREQYVTDKIDLEDFAAAVTALLLEGL